jgi:hypothetical protein
MREANEFKTFQELSVWHRDLLCRLLNVSFPGQQELKSQIMASHFRVIDANQSLEISPMSNIAAPVVKTVPVEGLASDKDGVPIQALLFTRRGAAYMLEILRGDGDSVKTLPPASAFDIIVLAT